MTRRSTTLDRIYDEGIYWLANNTENETAASDAIRLLAYLCDTTEEYVWQAVGYRQEAMAAGERKTQREDDYSPAEQDSRRRLGL